jgi:hypothetical protein
MTISDIPKKFLYLAGVILAMILLYAGFSGYQRYKEWAATQAHEQAEQQHTNGVIQSNQGATSGQQGASHEQAANGLQAKVDAADAEVARLKALLAKAKMDAANASQREPVPVGNGLPVVRDSVPVVDELKDALIAKQGEEIVVLKTQRDEFKEAMLSYKASAGHYKGAYESECRARNLDEIAHKAALSAAKARTWKVGIVSFGGGAALGAGFTAILKR